jgi:acetate kinase
MAVDEHDGLHILTLNSGSSSVKLALYHMGKAETLTLTGAIERIGVRGSLFRVANAAGESMDERHLDIPDHDVALRLLFEWLRARAPDQELDAVGHRIVHGGSQYSQPHLVTPDLLETLTGLVPLAPDHLPHEIKVISVVSHVYPAMKQVACFDTAFHRDMPRSAQMLPLPRHLEHKGVIRYGFHGLSYEYIMRALRKDAGTEAADGRIIIAHLGNGASMAAVRGGQGIDTTMGFTPAGGLVMSTRSGDLDPGIVVYLLEEMGLRPSSVSDLVNQQAGLLGVSGITSDMKDLLARESRAPHAAEAVELFCYQAKKFVGALAAVLGGLDTLIFTAGIGEHAPSIRWRICQGLEFLGVRLDAGRNDANAAIISRDGASATVRVMETNEELMIARHTRNLIRGIKRD